MKMVNCLTAQRNAQKRTKTPFIRQVFGKQRAAAGSFCPFPAIVADASPCKKA
jgi:hypothetical protein